MKWRLLRGVILSAVVLFGLYLVVYQGIFRFALGRVYVGPDQVLVVVSKFGDELPPGRVLAELGQKGIQAEVRGPGRYFLNPLSESWEIHPVVHVPAGENPTIGPEGNLVFGTPPSVGVVTSMVGSPLPSGDFLADEGEKGVWHRVLTPGKYPLNPYAYRVTLHPARVIEPGFVGVVTHLAGVNTQSELADAGQRGVQRDVLPPGLYYLNHLEYQVTPVRVGYQELTFENQSAITFPASDSNAINVDATIVWGLNPTDAPHIIKQFGSAELVVDRLIRPQCESVMRLQGSNYNARQFVEGDTRREFQAAVERDLKAALEAKNVRVLLALIRRIEVPEEVRAPIQEAKIAEEITLTYQVLTETSKIHQRLKAERGAVDIVAATAKSETHRQVQAGLARGQATVAAVDAQTELDAMTIAAETERTRAEIKREVGLAEAEIMRRGGKVMAEGLERRMEAFDDPEAYVNWRFAEQLPAKLAVELRTRGYGSIGSELADLLDSLRD